MNRHELIEYLCKRCKAYCDFAKALDSVGFDPIFQIQQLNTAGNCSSAAHILLNLNKC